MREVKKAEWPGAEVAKYAARRREEIARRMALRTGVDAAALGTETIRAMWLGCRAEVAAFDKSDGWCTVFSRRDAELLEFGDDMHAYYVKGHGHALSTLCAQPLLADIVRHMDDASGNAGVEAGRLRFAHAETLLPLVALLGMHEDAKPLTADWSDEEIAARKWRTAEISPLAGNVALAQYKCGAGEERYVELVHNEAVKAVPGCEEYGRLCPLSRFKYLHKSTLEIDWDKVCRD